jgi:hypothetical protein
MSIVEGAGTIIANGNVYTISANKQIIINGVVDPPSRSVEVLVDKI